MPSISFNCYKWVFAIARRTRFVSSAAASLTRRGTHAFVHEFTRAARMSRPRSRSMHSSRSPHVHRRKHTVTILWSVMYLLPCPDPTPARLTASQPPPRLTVVSLAAARARARCRPVTAQPGRVRSPRRLRARMPHLRRYRRCRPHCLSARAARLERINGHNRMTCTAHVLLQSRRGTPPPHCAAALEASRHAWTSCAGVATCALALARTSSPTTTASASLPAHSPFPSSLPPDSSALASPLPPVPGWEAALRAPSARALSSVPSSSCDAPTRSCSTNTSMSLSMRAGVRADAAGRARCRACTGDPAAASPSLSLRCTRSTGAYGSSSSVSSGHRSGDACTMATQRRRTASSCGASSSLVPVANAPAAVSAA